MNAIVKAEAREPVGNPADSLLANIMAASRDPSVDISKMKELMGMYKELLADQARVAFAGAMAKMQPKLPTIERKGRIIIREKNNQEKIVQSTPYALFEDINDAIKPLLEKHGFSVNFDSDTAPDGKITVTATVKHKLGHFERTTTPPMQYDSSGSKNAVQSVGSSLSYGKRYALTMALNITTRGEDDDGVKGGVTAPAGLSEDQVIELREMLEAKGANVDGFKKYFKIETLADLPVARFDEAKDLISRKAAR